MSDGLLLGAMLMLVGICVGGAGVWVMERWHDVERAKLLQHIGYIQDQMDQLQSSSGSIPEEEL